MINIKNGIIYIDGIKSTDAKKIGNELLKTANLSEKIVKDHFSEHKQLTEIIDKVQEFAILHEWMMEKTRAKDFPCLPVNKLFFHTNYWFVAKIVNIITAINDGYFIVNPNYEK